MTAKEQEAQNGQNTNTPTGEQTIKDLVGNFTPIPNTVLDTPTLSSNAKVTLGILLATYLYAKDTNALLDGTFYCATNRIAERMNISASQVRNDVLPELYKAGLVVKCDERRAIHGKFTNVYRINLDAVKSFQGTDITKEVEAKTAKAKKAMKGRVDKETQIKQEFLGYFISFVANINDFNRDAYYNQMVGMIMNKHPEYRKPVYVSQMVTRISKRVMEEHREYIQDYLRDKEEQARRERFNQLMEETYGGSTEHYNELYAQDTCEADEFDDDDFNPPF